MSGNRKNSIMRSKWMQLTLSLCISVLFYLFLSHIHLLLSGLGTFVGFVSPVLTGVVLAYVMNPLSNVFENYVFKKIGNKKNRHRLAVVTTLATVILLLTLLLMVLIPQLFNSAAYLVSHINIYADKLQGFVRQIGGTSVGKHLQIENLTDSVNGIVHFLSDRTDFVIVYNHLLLVEQSM